MDRANGSLRQLLRAGQEIQIKEQTNQVIYDPVNKARYMKAEFLGSGGFAQVFKVIKISPEKEVFACKVITKESLKQHNRKEKLELEITIQKRLSHQNIVKLEAFFEDNDNVYILLELCPYASLHDLIKRREVLSEMEARYFMLQLVDAMKTMHQKGVLHRDLKPINVFVAGQMQLKIGDFGLAVQLKQGERRKSWCGTPSFMAPEIVRNQQSRGRYSDGGSGVEYGLSPDIWALGIFLYYFVEGKNPFSGSDQEHTFSKIKRGDFQFTNEQQRTNQRRYLVSQEAKELVCALLNVDWRKRPTLDQVLQFDFFTNPRDNLPTYAIPQYLPKQLMDAPPSLEMIDNLVSQAQSKIKQITLAQEFVKVNYWMALEKYGIGYRLSDNTYGQLLPDKSFMFSCDGAICYKGSQDSEFDVFYNDDVPDKLHKKHKMLKWFRSEISVSQPQKPWFNFFGVKQQKLYVSRFLKLRQTAIIFYFSNNQVQINFENFTALIKEKPTQRNIFSILTFNNDPKDSSIIAIFDEINQQEPQQYEYIQGETDLDSLPIEVVTTIKSLHEANQLSIRQKIKEKSPLIKQKQSSPVHLKDTRKVLLDKVTQLRLRTLPSE